MALYLGRDRLKDGTIDVLPFKEFLAELASGGLIPG